MKHPCRATETDPGSDEFVAILLLVWSLNIKQFYSMIIEVSFEAKQLLIKIYSSNIYKYIVTKIVSRKYVGYDAGNRLFSSMYGSRTRCYLKLFHEAASQKDAEI